MKNIKIILAIAILAFVSCEDVLDNTPGDSYNEAVIYSDVALTESLVFYNYNVTENWGMNFADWWTRRIGIENASDESWFHWATNSRYTNNFSTTTPSNMGFYRNTWPVFYRYIGAANTFLGKIDGSPVAASNPDEVAVLKAEMKYLRANSYSQMINFWGGVPLVSEPYAFDADDFTVARASYEECVDFIVNELDEAIAIFDEHNDGPRQGAEFGRVSKGACMALKSRVLLYAASAQHDPSESSAPRGPLYDYTKASKWQDAANAAKALIDLGQYSLVPVNTSEEYHNMFLSPNSELIFARPYSPEFPNVPNDFNTLPDKAHSPVANGGWGLSNPTHNFVQDFKMSNGMRIGDAGSGYDVNDIYANRELRFYANINFQGSSFHGLELEYWSPFGNNSKDLLANDGRHFALTGYNLRKFLDESITIDVTQSTNRPFPLARLSEIYLNYAEAQYMLGNEGEARTYASMVSERVGLPAITSSGADLLEDIKYERQMELFFEHHRYYDLRRWMNEDKMGEDVLGVQWEKRNGSGELDVNGTLMMIPESVIEVRTFNKEDYYLPIPFDEVEKANLTQNDGYVN